MNCYICLTDIDTEGVCARCHAKMVSQLVDLERFYIAAHDELLPGNGGHGSSSGERTIGLNVAALSFVAGDDILKTLHSWESLIREERQLTPPALLDKKDVATEVKEAIAFQLKHLEWSEGHDWIYDFATELRDLHALGRNAARDYVDKTKRIICPADVEDGICGRVLNIPEARTDDIVVCKGCDTEWTTLRLVKVALATPGSEIWLDAEAIAAWLGITRQNVVRFAARNKVPRRGELFEMRAMIAARE